jgi:hypothetical protein
MPTIPYSGSGMDPFQRSRREKKKRHARAQRRYASTHREQISARNRERYLIKKAESERLALKVIQEAQEKADLAARLEALHWEPPPLTFREVLGY